MKTGSSLPSGGLLQANERSLGYLGAQLPPNARGTNYSRLAVKWRRALSEVCRGYKLLWKILNGSELVVEKKSPFAAVLTAVSCVIPGPAYLSPLFKKYGN